MDITVSEGAYLAGKSHFEQWTAQFIAEYYQPITDQMVLMAVRQIMAMPPQVKEQLAAREPKAWADMVKMAKANKMEV